MAAVTVHSDFGAQENKICHCFHFFPSICHEVMGLYLKKIHQPSVCIWEIPSLARVVTLYTQGKKPNGRSAVWWMLALKKQASHLMFGEFAFQLLEGCQRLLFPRRSFPLHQWFPNLKVYALVTEFCEKGVLLAKNIWETRRFLFLQLRCNRHIMLYKVPSLLTPRISNPV